jgi:hypothetical protein
MIAKFCKRQILERNLIASFIYFLEWFFWGFSGIGGRFERFFVMADGSLVGD